MRVGEQVKLTDDQGRTERTKPHDRLLQRLAIEEAVQNAGLPQHQGGRQECDKHGQSRNDAGPGETGSSATGRAHTGPLVISVRGPFTSNSLAFTLAIPNSLSLAVCLVM